MKNNILDDNESLKLENYFEDVKSVNMENVKSYYIDILSQIDEHQFANIVNYFENNRELRIGNGNKYENTNNIGMYITTKDAHTLTDGPTIFMTKAPEAIGKFCIQQANIPEQVLQDLNNRIHYNTQLGKKIDKLDREIEDQSTINTKSNSLNADGKGSSEKVKVQYKDTKEIQNLQKELSQLQCLLKDVKIDQQYVPNSTQHIEKWIPNELKSELKEIVSKPYYSIVEETYIQQIMELGNVVNIWKLLLIMGIGMFSDKNTPKYLEIMKKLAENQKLYLIIASDDYIYGTNYQFCHGYVSKDLANMTQEKIMQAIGRVGRNNIQKNYSIRFRNECFADRLFYPQENKPEVANMNKLFVC